MQAECRKRKSAGAPLVDRHGKPIGGKGVHEVESKEDELLGHLRQSSGDGCHSIQNKEGLNF